MSSLERNYYRGFRTIVYVFEPQDRLVPHDRQKVSSSSILLSSRACASVGW